MTNVAKCDQHALHGAQLQLPSFHLVVGLVDQTTTCQAEHLESLDLAAAINLIDFGRSR